MEFGETCCKSVRTRINVNLKFRNSLGKHSYPAVKALKIEHTEFTALKVSLHDIRIGN